MTMQTKSVHKKSRGRPAGTKYVETIPARLEKETLIRLDLWATAHEVSRSEAIRRLVEIGLSKSPSSKRPQVLSTAKQGAARAAELASKTIDKHLDPAASEEDRKVRKRKLVEGPNTFRKVRVDIPKAKA